MLDIAVDDSNALYKEGMQLFLQDLFQEAQNKSVHFSSLTPKNAIRADIIVKSFVAGAEYICQPILKYRTKPGLIIGIYEGEHNSNHHELPLCIKNIIFINRSETLSTTREKVIEAWGENIEDPKSSSCKKCLQCKYRTLTPQQVTIAKYLLRGNDIVEIAKLLNINVKTVSAHKRLMMSKFNLESDCELMHFLSNLKQHNPPVHLFSSKI